MHGVLDQHKIYSICDWENWLGPTVLRASSQKKLLCLQQITYQIQLNEILDFSQLGQLPNNISVYSISGGIIDVGGAGYRNIYNVVDAMMSNRVVWHKVPCRTSFIIAGTECLIKKNTPNQLHRKYML